MDNSILPDAIDSDRRRVVEISSVFGLQLSVRKKICLQLLNGSLTLTDCGLVQSYCPYLHCFQPQLHSRGKTWKAHCTRLVQHPTAFNRAFRTFFPLGLVETKNRAKKRVNFTPSWQARDFLTPFFPATLKKMIEIEDAIAGRLELPETVANCSHKRAAYANWQYQLNRERYLLHSIILFMSWSQPTDEHCKGMIPVVLTPWSASLKQPKQQVKRKKNNWCGFKSDLYKPLK